VLGIGRTVVRCAFCFGNLFFGAEVWRWTFKGVFERFFKELFGEPEFEYASDRRNRRQGPAGRVLVIFRMNVQNGTAPKALRWIRHGGGPVLRGSYPLDYCEDLIQSGDVAGGMSALFDFLFHARSAPETQTWKALVYDIREHPVTKLVHQCAIPQLAFHKPRGYPADAVLIHHLYVCGEAKTVDHP
jgi:hypothetical protein